MQKLIQKMTAKSIVLGHPDVFGVVSGALTEIDYITIIASNKSRGSEIQKISFFINTAYTAVCKLFDLGFSKDGAILATEVLKVSSAYHFYNVSAQLCKYLHRSYYKYEDLETALQFEKMFLLYNDMNFKEYEAQKIYLEVIYKYKHGLAIDLKELKKSLAALKEKLALDSCDYHYFYFQSLSIIAEGKGYLKICRRAIKYFKGLYFNHDAYVAIFSNKIVAYYIDIGRIDLSHREIKKLLKIVVAGSSRWFDAQYNLIHLLLSAGQVAKAQKQFDKVYQRKDFEQRPGDHKTEWNFLSQEIKAARQIKEFTHTIKA